MRRLDPAKGALQVQRLAGGDGRDVTTFTDDLDSSDSENDPFVGKKSQISLQDMDVVRWAADLHHDLDILKLLLLMLKDITPAHDSKLQLLLADLKEKFAHPINEDN